MAAQNTKKVKLAQKDKNYLRFIFQEIKREGVDVFRIEDLNRSWLGTEELKKSYRYWCRYLPSRKIGRSLSLPVGGCLLTGVFLIGGFGGIVLPGFFLISALVVFGSMFFVTRLATDLFALPPSKEDPLETDEMTEDQRKALLYTLQNEGLLPKSPNIWFKAMTNIGALVETESGYQFVSKEFTEWLMNTENIE